MRNLIFTTAGALLLAACGGGEPQENAAQAAANEQSAMEMEQRVAALAPGQREAVFIRAIRDAGVPCQGVTSHEKAPERATWVATCSDGGRHTITFGANGMAQVTSVTPQR